MTAERKCPECGNVLENWEGDICDNCKEAMNNLASAILFTDEIPPSAYDF